MTVLLAYNRSLAEYRFTESHPLRPERFTLAVELMRAWGLLAEDGASGGETREPVGSASLPQARVEATLAASDEDLLLIHTREYLDHVKLASDAPWAVFGHGIGPGDTPQFLGMHEAAALVAGATIGCVRSVLAGEARAAFSPAGGLHHAHRDYASGFCIYNDPAIAIERAIRDHPGLRVAYIDIDAHHGDGVEDAFYERADVLTLSVHESGRYLFPGTGRATDIGSGAGRGAALNVPLPPDADDACYELVAEQVIEPAVAAYAPDLVLIQAGGDTHRGDPLTHLYLSVEGYCELLARVLNVADSVAPGRTVVTGGGGYQPFSEVPRMWAAALALLLGRPVPEQLPPQWIESSRQAADAAGHEPSPAVRTFDEEMPDLTQERREIAMQATAHAVRSARQASPLLEGD